MGAVLKYFFHVSWICFFFYFGLFLYIVEENISVATHEKVHRGLFFFFQTSYVFICSFLTSNLIDYLADYRILGWNSFSFKILKLFLHYSLASGVVAKESFVILILYPFHKA